MDQDCPATVASRRFRNCVLQLGLHGLVLMCFLPSSLAVGDDIRWLDLSVPEVNRNRFEIDETRSIRAFARDTGRNGSNYDVTLIDEGGRMVRIDVSSGKHWELFPYRYEQKTAVPSPPPFKLIADDKKGDYLGRIYYPYGGTAVLCQHESGSLSVNSVVPYPTSNGFRGVLHSWSDGRTLKLSSYTANRGLGQFRVKPLDPLRIGGEQYILELPDSDEISCRNGQFLFASSSLNSVMTDRYCLGDGHLYNRKQLIYCRRWDGGHSFLINGRNFKDIQGDELLAAAPLAEPNAVVVVYREGLVYYSGQGKGTRTKAFRDGWRPQHRQCSTNFGNQNSLQFSTDGSRVQLLMEGPDRECELWTFDCRTLEVLQELALPSADRGASFQQQPGLLAVQTIQKRGGAFLLFKCQSDKDLPTLAGRTSPFNADLERAECWCLSDDEKMIFFVSRPHGEERLKLGQISVDSLRLETSPSPSANGSGFGEFLQKDIEFADLPARATDAIVGVLPRAEVWWGISPNNRWVVGLGDGLHLFDTLSRKTHMIPGGADAVAFSADSSLIATFWRDRVNVFDVSGDRPVFVASSDRLPEDIRSSLGELLRTANDGACFVSAESVATTNRNGSVRFQIDGPDLKVVYQNKENPKSRHAAFSEDGSSLAVWDYDGAVVRYKWTGQKWEGVSKVPVPFFDRRTHSHSNLRFHAMSPAGDRLAICANSKLTVWNNLQNLDQKPLSLVGQPANAIQFAPSIGWAAISVNQQWIVYIEKTNDSCRLTLVDRKLNVVASHQLPFQFTRGNGGLHVTNDGKHALVRNDSGLAYVIRLQVE